MDTNELIKDAKARFKHHEHKLYLQEKYRNKLTFASQGGMWTITPQFLSFLSIAPDTTILADDYGNPVEINVITLRGEAWKIYNESMQGWLTEHTESGKYR